MRSLDQVLVDLDGIARCVDAEENPNEKVSLREQQAALRARKRPRFVGRFRSISPGSSASSTERSDSWRASSPNMSTRLAMQVVEVRSGWPQMH